MCVCVELVCLADAVTSKRYIYLPTPLLRQDMTQGQFLSGI